MMFLVLRILFLSFFQNVAFSIVSRSRNRNNLKYHLFAATLSNTIWFLTFRALVTSNMDFVLFIPYTIGTVAGSLYGVSVSMKIETWLGAASDSHIKPKTIPVGVSEAIYITKDDLANALKPLVDRLTIVEGRIITIYSRVLRKLRTEMQLVRTMFNSRTNKNTGIFRPSAEFLEHQRIHEMLTPKKVPMAPRRRATPNWSKYDRAGQQRLAW